MSITVIPLADQRLDTPAVDAPTHHSLYALRGVSDRATASPHDGVSTITVDAVDWRAQFHELWAMLVPRIGAPVTVQGEVIHFVGLLHAVLTSDDDVRLTAEHRVRLEGLATLLDDGVRSPYNPVQLQRIVAAIRRGEATEALLDDLVRYGVAWVLAHPQPRPALG